MRKPKRFVSGTRFTFIEHAGFFKAHLNGWMGWTSVIADSYEHLERRIKQVRSGGQ